LSQNARAGEAGRNQTNGKGPQFPAHRIPPAAGSSPAIFFFYSGWLNRAVTGRFRAIGAGIINLLRSFPDPGHAKAIPGLERASVRAKG
jgi:hypothetical protein